MDRQTNGSTSRQWEFLTKLGDLLEDRGETEASLSLHQRAHDIAVAVKDDRRLADSLHNLGLNYEELARFRKRSITCAALSSCAKGREISAALLQPTSGSERMRYGTKRPCADITSKPLKCENSLATLWEAPELAPDMGTIYATQGRLTDALQLYRQSNGAFEQAGDKPSVASGLVNMANIAARQGLYSEAIQMEEQALELRRKVAGPPEVVQCLTNLGAIYDKRGRAGDYEKALELYNQALPDIEAAHNPQALAMLLDDFGAVYQHLKRTSRPLVIISRR